MDGRARSHRVTIILVIFLQKNELNALGQCQLLSADMLTVCWNV
jgi:hypothetical protein